MLSKCANSTCPATFRYLHEGKLYVIAPGESLAGRGSKRAPKSAKLEYAWLCSSCSLYLTIQIDEEFGARVVQKLAAPDGSSFGASANDSINADFA